MKSTLQLLLFAAVAGLLASFAFALAFFGGHEVWRTAPTAPWLALLLLLCVPLLGRLSRRVLGPHGPVAAALSMAMVAPMIALGALSELGEPLVEGFHRWCGTPRVMLEMSVPPAMFVAGAVGALVADRVVARGVANLHRVTMAFALIAALLTGASILRALLLPETDRYVETLPVAASLRAASGTPSIRPEPPSSERRPDRMPRGAADVARGPVAVYDADLGGAVLRRACAEHECSVALVLPGTPTADATFTSWDVKDDALVEVRRDAPRDIWVVKTEGRLAYRSPHLHAADVHVADVSSSLSPPRGWIAGAAFGLALAAAFLARRHRAALHHAALAAGREGMLEPSGLLTLAGGDPPLRVAPGQTLAVGPVVVLSGPLSPGGVYRGDGLSGGARVVCGIRADLLAAAEASMAERDALALATIALTVAPLLASLFVGIVI